MNIQWYPGHMAKSKRLVSENLKLVDAVIELLDARIPKSSKNPDLDDILAGKPRVVALNKADLADESISAEWEKWYSLKGRPVILVDSIRGKGINELKSTLRGIMKDRLERDKSRGRIFRAVRTMVVGIPNVGKSAFINKIAGKAVAVTGDRPGVTRGKQWVRLNEEFELLDTPGILWPRFEDPKVGLNLAFTGAIKDENLDTVGIASSLLELLALQYPSELSKRFKLGEIRDFRGAALLDETGRKRGCIVSGGEVDLNRIAAIVLDEFRGGKIGRISLERPEHDKYEGGFLNDRR